MFPGIKSYPFISRDFDDYIHPSMYYPWNLWIHLSLECFLMIKFWAVVTSSLLYLTMGIYKECSQEQISSDRLKWIMYLIVVEVMSGLQLPCIWLHSNIWVAKQMPRHDSKIADRCCLCPSILCLDESIAKYSDLCSVLL
jgi:hypothetical protein